MAEYQRGTLTVNGIELNYYRTGTGDRHIILLHGATDNGMCWKPVADKLGAEYDVIMPDAQGHGLSAKIDPDFEFVNHAHQIAGLIQQLAIEKPVLMGHSMGGSTSTNVAGIYPDMPLGIILEDPGWIDHPPAGEISPEKDDFVAALLETKKKTVDELIKECREQNPSWAEEELLPWAESKHQYDINLFSRLKINDPPYMDMIERIRCPALLITSESGIVSDETVVKAIDRSRLDTPLQHIKIMGAGHNIRREQFEQFYSVVTGFLEKLW